MTGKIVQHRRGTNAGHAAFTGAEGEFTYNTTTKTVHAHDGSTPGGIPMAKQSAVDGIQSKLGEIDGIQSKLGEIVSVKDFGAVGDGVANDTAAFNAALTTGKRTIVPAGTYSITTITMSVDGTEMVIEAGAVVKPSVALQKAIVVTGDNCRISGNGSIDSPSTFNGANERTTYATIWVEDCIGFVASGITLNSVPRSGIWFEDATAARIENVTIRGNYPYASYNENTTTGHNGIGYNPPAPAQGFKPWIQIVGCHIETCIQGFLYGNFDSYGSTAGIVITGNSFSECWDHAVYCTLAESTTVSGNNMLNCRRPIVVDGIGCVVSGNTLNSDGSSQSNHEQLIAVRNAQYATIVGNSIRGVGAGIDCSCVGGCTDIVGNIIANNTLRATAESAYLKESIRIGSFSTICDWNLVAGNSVFSYLTDATEYVVSFQCTSGFGKHNKFVGNHIVQSTGDASLVLVDRQVDMVVSGNTLTYHASTGSAATRDMLRLSSSSKAIVRDNQFDCVKGGTNVTLRGVNIASGSNNQITGNTFNLRSASLAGSITIIDSGTATFSRKNVLDDGYALSGKATIPSGSYYITVTNPNANANSIVHVTAANQTAGQAIASKGIFVSNAANSFTIYTGDFTNVAANADFNYSIE